MKAGIYRPGKKQAVYTSAHRKESDKVSKEDRLIKHFEGLVEGCVKLDYKKIRRLREAESFMRKFDDVPLDERSLSRLKELSRKLAKSASFRADEFDLNT